MTREGQQAANETAGAACIGTAAVVMGACTLTDETTMPKMSDQRRKRIQARQRKIENAVSRTAKITKKARNKS